MVWWGSKMIEKIDRIDPRGKSKNYARISRVILYIASSANITKCNKVC